MTRKVSISSVKASLLWLRRLAAGLILLFAAQGVWGYTYNWQGISNDWSNLNNWYVYETGANATTLPGTADTIIIPVTGNNPEITGDVTINPGSLSFGNDTVRILISGSLTLDGNFTLSNIDTDSTGTLIINQTLTNSSDFEAQNLSVVFNSYVSYSG